MKDGSLSARVTRQSGTSFYYAFRFLPARKRRAIYALYSFCRVVDDCVDEPGGEREGGLDRWLAEVHRCYAGQPSTRLGHELAEALSLFPIPRQCFEDIVAGCRMDLTTRRYPRFEDLLVYCHRVASAVGLAAIEIFEYVDAATRVYATELGVALQLTNILRDVRIDAGQDRLYLPLEDLARFGVSESEILVGPTGGPGVAALFAFEVQRAREYHDRARHLLPPQDRRAMLPARIMGAIYRELLGELARRGRPLDERLALGRPRKAWIALRTALRGD